MLPLFEQYPGTRETLPHTLLAELPTPVEPMARLGAALGVENLYIKRDDLTAPGYGGNKVRKLEFLLGRALRVDAKEVLTFGCAGSNHATATAFYARQLGLRGISMLLPQPNAHSVRRNLLVSHRCGAELNFYPNSTWLNMALPLVRALHRLSTGRWPEVIPAGGSSPLGVMGYVNAALELEAQIDRGEIPEPDRIYVAAGTTGTAAGLMLGLRAAGLKTQVMPIRVTGSTFARVDGIVDLARGAVNLLRECDDSFPAVDIRPKDVPMRDEFYGGQYARYTEESVAAVRQLDETEGIRLEGTYTGKAAAALIADARNGDLAGKTALFWNTYNSRDLGPLMADADYHEIPRALHSYFEEDVQPLDR